MSTARCPDRSVFARLLDGVLAPQEHAELAKHLDTCASCQKTLEALAADSGFLVNQARRWNPESQPQGTALEQVIENLKAQAVQAETISDSGAGEDCSLDFLSPSTTPGQLGRLDHYEILEVLGRGGMGVVLKARDTALQRVVAIKVLAPRLATNANARKRFIREAQAAAAVSHDHVVTIHAVSETNGVPYLVMECIRGQSLQQRLDREGPLELKEILRIGLQAARGLAAAHAQGLIHRDIKPANILLENGVERVKITDFGLARAVDDASLTQSGIVAGTAEYMAPEQACGEALDHRSDLFSLDSVLYAMCTGGSPFRASSMAAVLRRVCDDTPRPIREINPDIPNWLAAIIAKLHAKDPEDRFDSADEVADLLNQHLAHLQAPSKTPAPPMVVSLAERPRRMRVVEPAARSGVPGWLIAAGVLLALGLCLLPLGALAFWFFLADTTDVVTKLTVEPLVPENKPPGVEDPNLPPDLAMVPPDAVGFVHFNVRDMSYADVADAVWRMAGSGMASKMLEQLEEALGMKPADLNTVTLVIPAEKDQAVPSLLVLVTPLKEPSISELKKKLVGPEAKEQWVGEHRYYFKDETALSLVSPRTYLLGEKQSVHRFLQRSEPGPSDGPLSPAIKLAASNRHVVLAVNNQYPLGLSIVDQALGESEVIAQAQAVAVMLKLSKEPEFTLGLIFPDPATARAGREEVKASLKHLLASSDEQLDFRSLADPKPGTATPKPWPIRFLNEQAQAALESAEVHQSGAIVQAGIKLNLESMVALQLVATQRLREAANRLVCANNLKQIGLALPQYHQDHFPLRAAEWNQMWNLARQSGVETNLAEIGKAMHQYLKVHEHFPPAAISSKDGKPLLSWRVALLPYLGHEELYKQFKLDEPWDSEHNQKLLDKMPRVYSSVSGPEGDWMFRILPYIEQDFQKYAPSFQTPGGGPIPIYLCPSRRTLDWLPLPEFLWEMISDGTSNTIRDGTSNTILIDGKFWRRQPAQLPAGIVATWLCQPADANAAILSMALGSPLLSPTHAGGVNFVFSDGATRPGLSWWDWSEWPTMPVRTYFAPSDSISSVTHFRVFVGPGAAFEGTEGLTATRFADGMSSTILIVEAEDAVPWTKPDELLYSADKPLPKLGVPGRDGFYAVFGDGTVRLLMTRFLKEEFKEEMLRRLILRNDGMPVELDQLMEKK